MWPFILRYVNGWQCSHSVIFYTSSCSLITEPVLVYFGDTQSPHLPLGKVHLTKIPATARRINGKLFSLLLR